MFLKTITIKYKALLCHVPPSGRSSLLKVIVSFQVVIEAMISLGVVLGDWSILFSSSINSCYTFVKLL